MLAHYLKTFGFTLGGRYLHQNWVSRTLILELRNNDKVDQLPRNDDRFLDFFPSNVLLRYL